MDSGTLTYFQIPAMPPPTGSSPPPRSSALPPERSSESPIHTSPDRGLSGRPNPNKANVVPARKPLLRLELRDLSSDGARAFLRLVHASAALQDAINNVLVLLYKDMHVSCIAPTRSVTLVIREMDGVAYTTGRDIDDDHKEIHFSTKYIEFVPETRKKEEILGVIVHEMVHCWQHSGFGTAPSGLIEGVADWVRLKAGYAPPHWKRRTDCNWDAGYERTGYFLEWLEKEHGTDIVRRINEALRDCKYDADKVWHGCCGKGVEELWNEYKEDVSKDCDEKPKDKNEETLEEKGEDDSTAQEKRQAKVHEDYIEDHITTRAKARRGGNMHVPIRPGPSS